MLSKLNSKNLKDGIASHEIELDSDIEEDAWDVRKQLESNMPGAKKPNNA